MLAVAFLGYHQHRYFVGACDMAGQERAEHFLMEADDESAEHFFEHEAIRNMTFMMERKHIQSEMAMNLTLNLRFQLFRPFLLWMTGCFESADSPSKQAWLRVAEQEKHQREVEVTENEKNDETQMCEGLCHLIVVVTKKRSSLRISNCWPLLFNFKFPKKNFETTPWK